MSDKRDDDQLSFLTKIKNNIAFKINNAINDPDANQYAKEKTDKEKEKEEQNKKPQEPVITEKYEDPNPTDDGNPDEISFSRIVKKIWNYIKLIFEKGFFPFIAIILAMYVANEMIVYPAPIRVVFFIFVFVLCFLFKHVTILLGFFYLCKSGYDYYINNMAGGEKRRIMPRIYALLPVTTYRSESPLTAFFLSPFQYPKSKKDEEELVKVMEEYNNTLTESFAYLDKVKTLPFFVEGLKKISTNFEGMHTITEEKTNEPVPSESKPNEVKSNKQVPSESKSNSAPPLPLTIAQNTEKRTKEKENSITNSELENRVKEETERLKRPLSINERNQIRKKIIENKTASAKPTEELPPSLPVNNMPKNNTNLPRTIEQNIEMRKKEEEAKEANKKVMSEVEKLERPLTIEENKKLRSPSNTNNTKQNVKEEVTPSAPSEEQSAK